MSMFAFIERRLTRLIDVYQYVYANYVKRRDNRRFQKVDKALAGPRRFEMVQKIAISRLRLPMARMISLFFAYNIDNCKYVKHQSKEKA